MIINTILSPAQADELSFSGKQSVVIDVLRATTTIITAFIHGIRQVTPVASIAANSARAGGMILKGGERNMKRIDGFDLGNSPLEYEREVVEGKSLIFQSTNGSKAMVKAKFSTRILLCSFLNIDAVAKELLASNEDVDIICSGNNGGFSLEDSVCAGRLIAEIAAQRKDVTVSDSSLAALALHRAFGTDTNRLLNECEHGKLLKENGFSDDLIYCARLNTTDIIPVVKSGTITLLHQESGERL